MKTLNKTFFSFLLTALMLPVFFSAAEADCITKDCASMNGLSTSTESVTASSGGGEFDFDFSEPFFFVEEMVVYVYGASDELLYRGSFTKEEMEDNQELNSWLKKSEFLLSAGNQHYYQLNK